MKKIIIPVIAFAVVSFFTFSCGSSASQLEGVWTATSADLTSSKYDKNMSTLIEEEFANTSIVYGPKDKVEITRGSTVQVGVYSIDEATNTLTMGLPKDDPYHWEEEYVIQNRNSNQMTLAQTIDKEGTMVTLILEKKQ